jgi:predicted DNA-binding transcriptional regulator YafY
VAEKAIEAYGDTPWAQQLRDAFERITAGLGETVEITPEHLADRIDFGMEGIAVIDATVLETLDRAIRENRQVEMDYYRLDPGDEKHYKLEPYLLLSRRGAWYLVARDCTSGHVPMFNLSRIRSVVLLDSEFEYILSDFDREKYLGDMAWAYHSDEEHHVVIDFTGKAATLVEERIWHPQQKLRRLKDGRLRFEVMVNHLWDIYPWVLRWGAGAKVVRPKSLRNLIREEAHKLARVYS